MAVNFIWGTGEVTKRELFYQSQKEGSLGAKDPGLKLKILQKHLYWVKKVKKAIWTGEILSWTKTIGQALIPYFKLLYSDFTDSVKDLNNN